MEINAALVRELRERTGAGMMECKKALVETGGDIEAAVELMRKSGAAKADKKAGRIAAEGVVAVELSADGATVAMVEVNSETDFVAKGDEFQGFAQEVAAAALATAPADVEALQAAGLPGRAGVTVDGRRRELIAKIGENINVRRFYRRERGTGVLGVYRHGTRIGVVVHLEGGDNVLAKDIAMHVAASRPVAVDESGLPADLLAKEREIYLAQAQDSGKPADIIQKMVDGRLKKFMKEVTLLGQPFVKDPETTVAQLLAKHKARVLAFERFAVGEGLEKKSGNFAEEVMAQVGR
ncbi:MAG: translation elongation factor Ts [Gammaproteobacteria bacterium]|jgi:elongation factor Ts|nr:translation elongation factor Ts [Gammaproteobacteria bacterium]